MRQGRVAQLERSTVIWYTEKRTLAQLGCDCQNWKIPSSNLADTLDWAFGPNLVTRLLVILGSVYKNTIRMLDGLSRSYYKACDLFKFRQFFGNFVYHKHYGNKQNIGFQCFQGSKGKDKYSHREQQRICQTTYCKKVVCRCQEDQYSKQWVISF